MAGLKERPSLVGGGGKAWGLLQGLVQRQAGLLPGAAKDHCACSCYPDGWIRSNRAPEILQVEGLKVIAPAWFPGCVALGRLVTLSEP